MKKRTELLGPSFGEVSVIQLERLNDEEKKILVARSGPLDSHAERLRRNVADCS